MLFLSLLISNALFFRVIAVWIAARLYRTSFSELHTQQPKRKQPQIAALLGGKLKGA